jgi:hypothetical protein
MPKLLQNAANAGCANRPTLSLQLRCHAPIAMMVISRSRQIVVMDFSPRKPSITVSNLYCELCRCVFWLAHRFSFHSFILLSSCCVQKSTRTTPLSIAK